MIRRSSMEALERRALLASSAAPVIHPLVGFLAAGKMGPSSVSPLAESIYGSLAKVGTSRSGAPVAVGANAVTPFSLDWSPLKSQLAKAPLESAGARGVTLPIPRPDGSMGWFEVVEAPITETPIAGIKTFRGIGIDDLGSSLRLDYTPAGFHAQVLSTRGSYYIDPYFRNDAAGTYVSYFKRDMPADPNWMCEIDQGGGVIDAKAEATGDALDVVFDDELTDNISAITFGTQLRTFRAAVAASGEYTAFHGGTVALGQAAVVTAMNRVNGVYETELAIRLTLVANNSLLIYTNAGSDPYSNSSSDINTNTGNINSVIGSANYDIGHVFTTASGGVAYLGSVGGSLKGGGTTGTNSPVGDGFTIDYVAHEMGHQFGGNHTFNTTNSNRSAAHAYEPGSGSTIMAYAGILGSEDLQPHSDPFFHSESIQEIRTFVTSSIPSVGTTTATSNNPPTVSAGSNYTIPTGTPFALTASGNDPDGDPITFEWQERNLGPAALLTSPDNGASPLFRAWVPTTSPTRTLPRLQSILGGTNQTLNSAGRPVEKLFSVARTSNWRVIARDNKPGGGGVSTADMTLTVVNTGSAFAVTSPNAATLWYPTTQQTVTWNVAGTTGGGINTASVNIKLSTDGGFTFPVTLVAGTANDGTETFTLPLGYGTSQARIKVEAVGNIFFDIGNANFTISDTPPPPGAISGQTFEDRNADGAFNGNDVPRNGVVVYLDTDNDGFLDGGETSVTTSGAGNYNFGSLVADIYHVREQIPSGYVATSPAAAVADVVVTSGNTSTQDFFNFPYVYTGTGSTDAYTVRKSPPGPSVLYGDNFNRATLAGGTYAYTTTASGDGAAAIFSDQLLITNDGSVASNSNGAAYVTTPTGAFTGFSPTLTSNGGLLEWTFNMQQIRANPGGFGAGAYAVAYVLGSTSGVFASGAGAGSGYAVVAGNSGAPDPIRLIKFAGGVNGPATTILAQNAAQDIGNSYWSVKVVYDPATDQWQLYTRNDGSSAFADPTGGAGFAQSGSTVTDTTYVNTALTHSGPYWNYASGANQTARFDNFRLASSASTPKIEVAINGVPTYSVLPSQITTLGFDLGDGSDILEVDYANGSPIPSGGIAYDGQDGVNDVLKLLGTDAADAITVNTSNVSFGGQILYTNAERLLAVTLDGDDTVTIAQPTGLAVQFQGGSGTTNTLNINAGSQTISSDIGDTTVSTVVNVAGAGTNVTFAQTQHLDQLNITGAGVASMVQNGSRKLVLDDLSIAGAGSKLDLADNDMIVRFGDLGSWTGSAYSGITGKIAAGRADGSWTGDGIVTSLSAGGDSTTRTLGVASAAELLDLDPSETSTWDGETVNASSVIVKYTYAGDANLDGQLNGDDYFNLDSNVLNSGSIFGYFAGDLNFDGAINGDDYFWLDGQILSQGTLI